MGIENMPQIIQDPLQELKWSWHTSIDSSRIPPNHGIEHRMTRVFEELSL